MKKGLVFLMFFSVIISMVYASDEKKYPIGSLSAVLRKDADAVKRVEEQKLNLQNSALGTYKVKYAITILNKRGDDHGALVVYYDKLRKIKDFSGTLYDSLGNVLRKVRNYEINDYAASDGFSLYSDNRLKEVKLTHNQYPYTVEFEYELYFDGLLNLPDWQPVNDYALSVEKSSFELTCSDQYKIRYKEQRIPKPVIISKTEGKAIYTWSLENNLAYKREPYSPNLHELTPVLMLAPSEFSIEGYQGDMSGWKSFGEWNYHLNQNRDILPENVKAEVKEVVAKTSDKREQIKLLYEYLQKNTRYISVQLGIGGWQTFDANYVASKGYGDCKALTNYMYSLLKEAGIESNYTLVYAGENAPQIQYDFPSNQFNHAILSVPMAKDTVWLECTSQSNAFNYLGGFTNNRWVLMVTPEGGKLVRTPNYGKKENLQARNIQMVINTDGSGTAKAVTEYNGLQQDDLSYAISSGSTGEQEKQLYESLKIPGLKINKFSYEKQNGRIPSVKENLELEFENYATISGKRLFVVPNLLNRIERTLSDFENRRTDVVLQYSYTDIDTVSFNIPEGYTLEAKPTDVNLKNNYGEFSSVIKLEGNTITYIRKRIMNSGSFPAEKYKELYDFYLVMAKADKSKIVLVNSPIASK